MEDKYFNFTIVHRGDEVHVGVVRAKDKEEAMTKIRDNDFDVIDEHECEGEYDYGSVEFEDEWD